MAWKRSTEKKETAYSGRGQATFLFLSFNSRKIVRNLAYVSRKGDRERMNRKKERQEKTQPVQSVIFKHCL